MASLTGNSISSTYTSLLKVGDNGTLAASLQSITDGAGNSSGISLNTAGALTATGTITANAFAGPLTGNVTGDLTGTASLASNLTGTPNISVGTIAASGTITGNVTGDLTGNVTGNVSGSSGSTTGNAATATALQTARTIAGVSFDGTANISLDTSNITENASYLYYTAERVDDQANTLIQAGTGITKTYDDTAGTLTIANNAPDQTVALTGGTGITTSGTYPNFTITNSAPDQTVALSAGTGINITGTYPSFTIANTGSGIGLTDLSATDAGGLGSFSYNNSSGVFTYTGASDSDVRGLISVTDSGGDGSLAYNNSTGVITYTGPSQSEVQAHITKSYVDGLGIAASTAATLATARTINGTSFDGSANISFDTDSVSEGSSNLYYTAERVDDQANTLIQAGTGITKTYDDAAGTLTITNNAPDQTVALNAGSNVTVSGTYPTFTIAATDTQTDSFKTISVSGQTDIVADSSTDTLTLAAGSNMTLTTAAGSDTITFAATDTNTTYSAGTGLALGGTIFSLNAALNNLTDVTITNPAAGHVLIYDNTNSIFENAVLTAGSNVSITNADGAITIAATDTQTDSFKTIAVSGQTNVVADSATDTLTLAAGSNVSITTTAGTDTVTFASTDTTYTAGTGLNLSSTTFSLNASANNLTDVNLTNPAAGHLMIYDNTNSYFENATLTAGTGIGITNADGSITIANTAVGDNAFGNIAVSGQTTIAADSTNDTLTIAAGSNVSLTTNAGTDTLTISATAGANTIAIDTYTGNGSTAAYTLSNSASSENELLVYFDGVYQLHSSYTVSGTTLTFDTNVPNGTSIEVMHLVAVNLSNVVESITGGDGITASAGTGDVTLSLSSSTPNAFTMGGNGSSGGVTVADGSIQIRTGTGNVAEMRFYCETGNAHYQTLKAAPHSAASSAVLVLPTASGNLVGTGDTGTVSATMLATDSVQTAKIVDLNVTTAKIANDNITHDKLENRYTALSALGSGTSFALDFSAATTFTATASGNATFTFSNAKQGQVIDLILTGNHTITFSQTNATFNKVGTADYDGSANNLVQIICTDDSANPVYMYSIGTYTSDPTP
jgi:hypothetical protein